MPDIAKFITFLENKFHQQIKSHTVIPLTDGDLRPFPQTLDDRLRQALIGQGIRSLYAHQAQAYESIIAGRNTLMVSQTASGKTLSFLLPILNEYVQAKSPFTVLFIYPTKALSRDQESTIGTLLAAVGSRLQVGVFDGDTPREERQRLQTSADFIVSNPDMLHSGILPNHNRNWKSFLARLRYVIIDEVHIYRGAFGSHVANVFRRLRRACSVHGSRPLFIGSSATVGNPEAFVTALFQQPFNIINQDGAPRPQRDLYLINPPMIHNASAGYFRKGPSSITIPLMREAARLQIRTICFCRARQQVERLYRAVVDGHDELKPVIKPYRGGLLPNERRQLERDLFGGKLNTIITTNALELGINIGDLELCLLSGHPGSVASFWQQAGRVGRSGKRSLVVYVANDSPIDQYLVHHPDFISSTPFEQACLHADNPYIVLQHLPCAAHEHPLRATEEEFAEPAYSAALEVLKQQKTLASYREYYRYALRDYPARGVNLRGMTDHNVDIYCGSEIIGEIDPIGARGTLYKDAIYQHLGKRYMSLDLDLQKKLCQVEEVNVDYFTEAVWEGRVLMSEVEQKREQHAAKLEFGYINVNKQPKLYKKIRERSFENIGYGPITLEPFIYDTTGWCLLPPPAWIDAVKVRDLRYIGAALFGLSYILQRAAPALCMGDKQDIGTDVYLAEAGESVWKSSLFMYDTHEGGVGYAEKIYELISETFTLCQQIIRECECKFGCPACVPPLPPGIPDEELESLMIQSNAAQACTRSLLTALLDGRVEVPEVTYEKVRIAKLSTPPEIDPEAERLKGRLLRSASILRDKRERKH